MEFVSYRKKLAFLIQLILKKLDRKSHFFSIDTKCSFYIFPSPTDKSSLMKSPRETLRSRTPRRGFLREHSRKLRY